MLDDVERRKEVFAWFGGAAYHAQCFEVELQSLLLLTHRLNNPDAPVSELDDVDLRLSRKNLGTLLRELGMQFQLHPEFDGLLSTYRDRRNYLMHRFFFENARKLLKLPAAGLLTAPRERSKLGPGPGDAPPPSVASGEAPSAG